MGTREVMARALTLDRGPILPGGEAWALLDCEEPVVARVRDPFVLRFYSPVTTIAGGRVCALDPPRSWRTQREDWKALVGESDVEATVAAVRMAKGRGLEEKALPLVTGLSPAAVRRALENCTAVTLVGGSWYDEEVVRGAAVGVLSYLEKVHTRRRRESMVPLESLRAGLAGRYAADLLGHAIGQLTAAGAVCVDGPGIRLTGHEAGLSLDETRTLDLLLETLGTAGLAPPAPADLARRLKIDRDLLNDLLRLLEEREEIVQVSPEMYVTRPEEERARRIVREIAGHGPATPGKFRDAFGVTRKHLIPLLEYMDRAGVTRRTPEGRVTTGD
jgi:selenocysteine-specific elongation factor